MKIGFLITYFYPFSGGAESNCYYLAEEMAKRGHEVHVFTSDRKDGKIIEKKEELVDGIHIHRFRTWFRYKYYLALYPSILKILKYDLDILHVHAFGFVQQDIIVLLEKIRGKTKLICTPHGPFMALKEYNLPSRILKSLYMPFLKLVDRQYDKIIKVNDFQFEWMKDYGGRKNQIVLLPNGIPEETFRKISPKELLNVEKKFNLKGKFVIAYLGRIQQYKGLDQVIKILPNLAKIKKNIVFVAAGQDAGDRERLERLTKELRVNENVIFTGKVSESEKLALLDLSEVFVFPSEWEAFGIVLLEAMARKNAVISTSTEGGRFLVKKENGFTYRFGNLKELESKISIVLNNSQLRKKMQHNNIKKARNFLWKDIAVKLESIYTTMLK